MIEEIACAIVECSQNNTHILARFFNVVVSNSYNTWIQVGAEIVNGMVVRVKLTYMYDSRTSIKTQVVEVIGIIYGTVIF